MEQKIIRLPRVMDMVTLKKSAIYELSKKGQFPKSFPIGLRSKGWFESDIVDWINRRAGKLPAIDEPGPRETACSPLASPPPLSEMLKAPLGTELLRPDEIARITGNKSDRDQAKWLTDNRWQFHINDKGEVIIGRMYARLRMCGIDPAALR